MARLLIFVLLLLPQDTIQVKVSLVTVGVRVTDSRGRTIPNLKAENFSVFDDGVAQKIEFFSNEEQPITMGILFDHSFSMLDNFKIDRAKEAATALVRATHEDSEYFYIAFDDHVKLVTDFTPEREKVVTAIQKTPIGGGTSLYDAVLEGITVSSKAQLPRQALVIISDGADQHSKHKLEEMMSLVRESEMQIFTIGYFGREEEKTFRESGPKVTLLSGAEIDNPRAVLTRLAKESGGAAFFPKNDVELTKAVDDIANDIRTQYTVSFYPKPSERENRYHPLRVTVSGGRYEVRARPGYGTLELPAAAARPDTSRAYESKVEKKDGLIVYRDDFEDKSSGWPDRNSAKYTRDGYQLTGTNVSATNGPVFKNFRAGVSVTVSAVTTGIPGLSTGATIDRLPSSVAPVTGGGLIFRQTDDGYYALVAFPGSANTLSVIRAERLTTTEVDHWPLLRTAGPTTQLEVRCREVECEIYQENTLRGKVKDSRFFEGRVGLYLSGRGDALFRNLIVEELK